MTQPIAPMGKNRIGMRKSMTKLYSLQEAEELYAAWEKKDYLCASIAKQLADIMRENERLYNALHDLHSLYAEIDRTLDPAEVCGEVQELLYGDRI